MPYASPEPIFSYPFPIIPSAQDFLPIDVTRIVFLGASITSGCVSGKSGYITKLLSTYGVDTAATIVNASVGGRHVDEIHYDGWEPIKSNYTGDATTLVVMLDVLANDTITLHPYSTATEENINIVKSELDDLTASILANGNIPIFLDGIFFDWDKDTTSFYDESLSAKPFSENILYPVVEAQAQSQYYLPTDRPYLNVYEWSYNTSRLVVTDGTGIHPNVEGSELLLREMCSQLADLILGNDSPREFEKLTAVDAVNAARYPASIMLSVSATENTAPSGTAPFLNLLKLTGTSVNAVMVPDSGSTPCSITISNTADALTYSTNFGVVYDDGGDYSPRLTLAHIRGRYGQTTGTTKIPIFTLGGFDPNQAVSIGFCSEGNSADNRLVDFTVNGVTTVRCNGKPASGTNVVYADVTADSSGNIAVEMQKISGYAAYFNGCHVIV